MNNNLNIASDSTLPEPLPSLPLLPPLPLPIPSTPSSLLALFVLLSVCERRSQPQVATFTPDRPDRAISAPVPSTRPPPACHHPLPPRSAPAVTPPPPPPSPVAYGVTLHRVTPRHDTDSRHTARHGRSTHACRLRRRTNRAETGRYLQPERVGGRRSQSAVAVGGRRGSTVPTGWVAVNPSIRHARPPSH